MKVEEFIIFNPIINCVMDTAGWPSDGYVWVELEDLTMGTIPAFTHDDSWVHKSLYTINDSESVVLIPLISGAGYEYLDYSNPITINEYLDAFPGVIII